MDYEHQVFISYTHENLWTGWVQELFVPRLEAFLRLQVGRDNSKIFVDNQIQSGARWADVLKHKVARSRVMICLISADYFQSDWCRREMALMMERENHLGITPQGDNYGLVIPLRLGDGDMFPELVKRVQYLDFEEFADPDLSPGTERASRFNEKIKAAAKTVANTLQKSPGCCDPNWQKFTGKGVFTKLKARPLPAPSPSRIIV